MKEEKDTKPSRTSFYYLCENICTSNVSLILSKITGTI